MGHHQVPVVEDEVRDQSATPFPRGHPELVGLVGELGQRPLQPVAGLDVAAVQRPDQLRLVIARHGQRVARGGHAHRQPQHAHRGRSAVDQIADEDHPASPRMFGVDRPALLVAGHGVAEPVEQHEQFVEAAVHVADHVERSVLVAEVVQQPLPDDHRPVDLVHRRQHVHPAEALPGQPADRPAQLSRLPLDRAVAEGPIGADGVALDRHLGRHVEDDRHRQDVVVARQSHQRRPRLLGHVGRVDDREQSAVQALAGDVVQDVEGVGACRLVGLVAADQRPAVVRTEHLVRLERPRGEGRLARPGDADQHHQAEGGDLQLAHWSASTRLNSASWVGEPASASTAPTPRSSTR